MRNRLQWFIHLRAHSLRKGDEHPAYTLYRVWHSFTFLGYVGYRTDRKMNVDARSSTQVLKYMFHTGMV